MKTLRQTCVSHKQKRRTRKRSCSKNREDWIRCRANCPRLTEKVKHHCSPSGMMNSNVRYCKTRLPASRLLHSSLSLSRERERSRRRGTLLLLGGPSPRRFVLSSSTDDPEAFNCAYVERLVHTSMRQAILLRARLYNLSLRVHDVCMCVCVCVPTTHFQCLYLRLMSISARGTGSLVKRTNEGGYGSDNISFLSVVHSFLSLLRQNTEMSVVFFFDNLSGEMYSVDLPFLRLAEICRRKKQVCQ